MVNGGFGLARLNNGQVILLRNSLPGETVLHTVHSQKKKTLFGRVDSVLDGHSSRITPPCPYYGDCGGCDLQHCRYNGQMQVKQEILNELFSRFSITVLPFVASPEQFGYRQRIRLQTEGDRTGFYAFRSSEIVAIEACLLAHPLINSVYKTIRLLKEFQTLCRNSSAVELLYNPGTNAITLLFHYQRPPRPNDRKTAVLLTEKTDSLERIFFKGGGFSLDGPFHRQDLQPGGSKTFSEEIAHGQNDTTYTVSWEVGGFCQVNLGQNRQLLKYVLKKVGSCRECDLLDLFCGMGNFSIPLASSAKSLTGVEAQGAAIRCAKLNGIAAGLTNTDFIQGQVNDICVQFLQQGRTFDVTIVDPPRQGLADLVPTLAALTSRTIVYISCDPSTLVRDIASLLDANFRLIEVQPFDMFPQTHHIETVALLEKN